MAGKSLAEKAHVKPGATIACINEERAVVATVGFPQPCSEVAVERASIVLLFVRDRKELESLMPAAIRDLAPNAALWVFFRKGSKGSGLDMNRDDVWAVAERRGMRPIGVNSVDDTWSVFRLKPPASRASPTATP